MASILPRMICRRGVSGLRNATLPSTSTSASSTTISSHRFSTSSRMRDDAEPEEAPPGDAQTPRLRMDMRFQNHVTLMGRVAKAPVTVGEGPREITLFDLVTRRYYENEDGEVVDDPHYHSILVSNKTKGIHNYVKDKVRKGDRVYVEGSLQYRSKETKDGKMKKDPSIHVDDLITVGSAY